MYRPRFKGSKKIRSALQIRVRGISMKPQLNRFARVDSRITGKQRGHPSSD